MPLNAKIFDLELSSGLGMQNIEIDFFTIQGENVRSFQFAIIRSQNIQIIIFNVLGHVCRMLKLFNLNFWSPKTSNQFSTF